VRCRPARLEAADAALGAPLAEALADPELAVSVRADLPAVHHVLRAMEAETSEGPPLPEALEAPGVTVDRMRAFAEAARELHEAAPVAARGVGETLAASIVDSKEADSQAWTYRSMPQGGDSLLFTQASAGHLNVTV